MTEKPATSNELTQEQQKMFDGIMHTPLDFWPKELFLLAEEMIQREGMNHDTLPKIATIWVQQQSEK